MQAVESCAALPNVYKSVIKLSRKAPRSRQRHAHKIKFLRNAVFGMPWSTATRSRVATQNLPFQQFYAELEAEIQLDKEAALANLRDSAVQPRRSPVPENTTGVLYKGQGRYVNDPTGLRRIFAKPLRAFNSEANRSSKPFPQRKAKFDPLSVQGCFNCGGKHLLKDCLEPLNTVLAASRKIEYNLSLLECISNFIIQSPKDCTY